MSSVSCATDICCVCDKKNSSFSATILSSKSQRHCGAVLAFIRERIFEVLCSDSVTSLLNAQFVTWAWDATQEANKSVLVNWLQRLDVREAHRVVRRLTFPSEFWKRRLTYFSELILLTYLALLEWVVRLFFLSTTVDCTFANCLRCKVWSIKWLSTWWELSVLQVMSIISYLRGFIHSPLERFYVNLDAYLRWRSHSVSLKWCRRSKENLLSTAFDCDHLMLFRARTEHFPLLLLVTKEKGVVQMFDMCSGKWFHWDI